MAAIRTGPRARRRHLPVVLLQPVYTSIVKQLRRAKAQIIITLLSVGVLWTLRRGHTHLAFSPASRTSPAHLVLTVGVQVRLGDTKKDGLRWLRWLSLLGIGCYQAEVTDSQKDWRSNSMRRAVVCVYVLQSWAIHKQPGDYGPAIY